MTRLTRRRLVAALGAGSVAALAGCTGDEEAPATDESAGGGDADTTEAMGEDTTDEATDAGASDDSDGDSSDASNGDTGDVAVDGGAERAIYDYLQGVDAGDVETANEALHPESSLRLEEGDITEPGVTIHEIEQVELREAVRARTDAEGEELDQQVAEREDEIEELLAEHGADDYASVHISITSEQYGDEERHVLVLRVDGEWLVWGQ